MCFHVDRASADSEAFDGSSARAVRSSVLSSADSIAHTSFLRKFATGAIVFDDYAFDCSAVSLKADLRLSSAFAMNKSSPHRLCEVDGRLVFTDLLGNEILGAGVSISEPIAAGSTYPWNGELEYNQFIDSHKRLRIQGSDDLRVVFKPGKFLYADGSRS